MIRARIQETLRRSYEQLKRDLNSCLYSLRVGRDIRLIMAVDDDPVFGRILVTLFRAGIKSQEAVEHHRVARVSRLFDAWGVFQEASKYTGNMCCRSRD